jgi:hypothetical protein
MDDQTLNSTLESVLTRFLEYQEQFENCFSFFQETKQDITIEGFGKAFSNFISENWQEDLKNIFEKVDSTGLTTFEIEILSNFIADRVNIFDDQERLHFFFQIPLFTDNFRYENVYYSSCHLLETKK